MKKLSVLLVCGLLLAMVSGCSGNNSTPDTSAASSPTQAAAEAAADGYTPQGEEAIHITVESAEVTLDQLKENDYKVILTVNMDKNAGIVSSQWGLQFEQTCTVVAENEGMVVGTVYAINDETHFLWTAWAGTGTTATGGILQIGVTLPRDAAPGNTYNVTYADTSAVGDPHQWKSLDTDYVAADAVGWTNGTITVVE